MNIEKIAINGYSVWVDKDAKVKEGDILPYILRWNDDTCELVNLNNGIRGSKIPFANKIIAASTELNLKGIPTHVEWLADESVKDWGFTIETERHSLLPQYCKQSFIKGYQAAMNEISDISQK